MGKPNKNIDSFLKAAKQQAAHKQQDTEGQTAKRAALAELYAQSLQPVIEALNALPAKNGWKFSCEVNYRAQAAGCDLEVQIVYHTDDGKKPLASNEWRKISFATSCFQGSQSYFLYDIRANSKMRMNSYVSISGFDAAPALLGNWVAIVAPECLPELAALLQKKNETKPPKPQKSRQKLTPLKPLQYKKDR